MDEAKQLFTQYNFPSYSKFRDILKANNIKLSTKETQDIINGNNTSQVHRQIFKQPEKHYYITALEIFESVQIDLLDYQKFATTNRGFTFILVAIDVYSRYAFCCPVKNKQPQTILTAFQSFNMQPQDIVHDSGGEFKGIFMKWTEEHNMVNWITEVGNHFLLGVIDRFSKTIKTAISKYMTSQNTTTYCDKLDDIIKYYNLTPNEGIGGIAPAKVLTDFDSYDAVKNMNIEKIQFNKELAETEQKKVKVGDMVRVKLSKKTFRKGYEITYSTDVFEIAEIDGRGVILDNGERYLIRDVMVVNQGSNFVQNNARENAERRAQLRRRVAREGLD
jgi:hypothetical protein